MLIKVFLTAIREFKATAMTKAFLFGTILLPAIIGGVLWAAGSAGLLSQQAKPVEGAIALVDPTNGDLSRRVRLLLQPPAEPLGAEPSAEPATQDEALADLYHGRGLKPEPSAEPATQDESSPAPASDAGDADAPQTAGAEQAPQPQRQTGRFNPPNVSVETLTPDADLEPIRQRVIGGELLGVAIATPESLEPGGNLELLVGASAGARHIETVQEAIQRAVVDHRLVSTGANAQEIRRLVREPGIATRTLTAEGETGSSQALLKILPFAGLILMAMAIFTGSGYLLMSTVEEKSSRVMEVLLSGMSPMQLMTGKIVGQGLVGLVTLAIYAGLGLFAADQFNMFSLIPPALFAWLFIYFIMGYFIFAAINAALGAAVNEMREAQALQGPVIGVTILMIYLAIFSTMMTDNPHSTLAQVLSFIPPATPFVMPVRLGYINDPMPVWQLIGAPIVGFAGMLVSVWIAARVFRVGVLMYGQPPNLRTLVKWMRYK